MYSHSQIFAIRLICIQNSRKSLIKPLITEAEQTYKKNKSSVLLIEFL